MYAMQGMQSRDDRKNNNRQFQEASSLRKASNDTQFFWDMVNRNRGPYGAAGARRPVNKAQEEKVLFGKANADTVEHGFIDDNIPVERSGPRADEIPVLATFAELEGQIPPYVTQNIKLMKYVHPTPIQKHAVPLGLAGVDLMCCAQTGSGKTFSFMLPVVAAMERDSKVRVAASLPPKEVSASSDGLTDSGCTPDEGNALNPEQQQPSQKSLEEASNNTAAFHFVERVSIGDRGALPLAVVLAPTRELASQIHLDARRLMHGSNLKAVCVYGGNDLRTQLTELSTGCDLIVATPGRLNDLVDRGCVSLSSVTLLVLDEADRMLDMGFEPQIRRIIQENDMPPTGERQTFLFSATFPDEIQTLAREFLRNYVWVGVGRVGSTVDNIKQQILCASADPNDKIKLLLGAIDQTEGRTLVFVQKRRTASWLCDCLRGQCHIKAEEIHGDRTQAQREHALRQFRDGQIRILVATDVAARGLDVPAVTHVIQFDLPLSAEDFDVYVHRIGRTGRAGMGGMATALFVPGRELGEGNGKIAPQILRLLQENGQEVPEWFAHLDDHNPGYNNRGGGNYKQRQPYGGRGGGGGYGNNNYYGNNNAGGGGYHNNQRFGGRDVRGDQQHYSYTESTNYGQQQQGGYQAQGYAHQQQHQGGYQGRGAGGRGGYGQQHQGYQQQHGGYAQQQGGRGGYDQQDSMGGYNARRAPQTQGYPAQHQQNGYPQQQAAYGASAYGAQHQQYPTEGVSPVASVPVPTQNLYATTAPDASSYYDPYSGTYVAATPVTVPVAVDPAAAAYGAVPMPVDPLSAQFSHLNMQGARASPASNGYAPRGVSQQQGMPVQGGGVPRAVPGRAMDYSAVPYVPQQHGQSPVAAPMADPYAYPQQHQHQPQGYPQQQHQGYQSAKPYQQQQASPYQQQQQQYPQQGGYAAQYAQGGRGAGPGSNYQQQQRQQYRPQAQAQGQAQGMPPQQQYQDHSQAQYAYSEYPEASGAVATAEAPSADAAPAAAPAN